MKSINNLKKFLKKTVPEGVNGAAKSFYQRVWSDEYEYYNGMILKFSCINHRFPEIVNLYLSIPEELFGMDKTFIESMQTFIEDYMLRSLTPLITQFGNDMRNESKEIRAKGDVKSQKVNNKVVRRSGLVYDGQSFVLKLWCRFPLIGVTSVSGTKASRMITDILKLMDDWISSFNINDLIQKSKLYIHQMEIRQYLKENGYICFVKNGSILPRSSDGITPKEKAKSFVSPQDVEITISLSDGSSITGMGIKKGITVITGGGYSGKTTLLDAIESGIYNHIAEDGREYVITENTALKTYAEDGRPVNNLNMSPFFKFFSNDMNTENFSTQHASGSVSQAANIIEAIYAKSKLLLIDEDKSATNFMIRDEIMRTIIKSEPIIPLTDRLYEMSDNLDVSVILVIGGISDYFKYADTILLVENYELYDISKELCTEIKNFDTEENIIWTNSRYINIDPKCFANKIFYTVHSDSNRKILLEEFVSDVTALTAITSDEQLNSLAYVVEKVVTKKEENDLYDDVTKITKSMYGLDEVADSMNLLLKRTDRWYEEIRSIDALCCINRLRGLTFSSERFFSKEDVSKYYTT